MSDPLINPDDLGVYLNVDLDGQAETARALLILSLAQNLCESIVSPLPAGSEAVILDVAARAYTNPINVSSGGVNPVSVAFAPGAGGLRLTLANVTTLRRLAGSGGAFSVDALAPSYTVALPWWGTTQVAEGWY